jgi:hypothetical protein
VVVVQLWLWHGCCGVHAAVLLLWHFCCCYVGIVMTMVALMQMWLLSRADAMLWCSIGAAVTLVWLWHSCCEIGAGMGFGASCGIGIIVASGLWATSIAAITLVWRHLCVPAQALGMLLGFWGCCCSFGNADSYCNRICFFSNLILFLCAFFTMLLISLSLSSIFVAVGNFTKLFLMHTQRFSSNKTIPNCQFKT